MTAPTLARRLGTGDAVVVGLAAMIGAGVFAVFPAAADAAGLGLLAGLAIAAVVATCNGLSSAQLASTYPSSGGTYLYGREVLGQWPGFLAGWGFVVGKTASCAAMALTAAAYVVPGTGARRLVAAAAVVVLTAANLRGITKTARLARALLAVTMVVLVGFVAIAGTHATGHADWPDAHGGVGGVLQSAGLLFFAFAGYARIATLAEEVRRPEQIGRAVLVALGLALVVYVAVAAALLAVLGDDLPGSATPLERAVRVAGAGWAAPVVRVGAVAASLGALLALLAGVSRTMLAMARERDLPAPLAHVGEAHRIPDRAELLVGAVVLVLVLSTDLRGAIGFSSFGVLVYYAVANTAALRQPAGQRRWPRALNVLGLVGCVTLACTLPRAAVVSGLVVLGVGLAGRAVVLARRPAAQSSVTGSDSTP